jgi:type VI secretion system secreted protein Hcp
MTVKGTKQGVLKGTSPRKNIRVLSYELQCVVPYDTATGTVSGRRQHKPVKIQKECDAASPQLWQALCTNEVLETVQIVVFTEDAAGTELVQRTITLTNASVVDVHDLPVPPSSDGEMIFREIEEVSFTFQRIEIGNPIGQTSACDDWNING